MSHTLTRTASPSRPSPPRRSESLVVGLKARLVCVDLAALTIGWIGVLALRTAVDRLPSTLGPYNVGWAVCAVVFNLALLAAHDLYLARVCSVRAVELQGLGRSVLGTCLAIVALERLLGTELRLRELWIAGLITFALLALGRAAFTAWLRHQRAGGRFVRDVLIVGADPDAAEIVAVMREHPELGFRASGYVGDAGLDGLVGAPHQGPISRTVSVVERISATGVVIVPSAVESNVLNVLVRQLLASGVHVHLSSGLRGIAHRRFRATPMAYEPLFYVEPASLTPWQMLCKRTIDLIGSTIGLVVTAPILAIAMVVIKLDSPGPVLFRQQRVGRNGQCFEFLKLRTMVRDAEAQRARLDSQNHRTSGPLFKAAGDPRVTRVGRVLRATSLDELPQLWNVLRGSMSLVGPRPALPSEVVQFDERLQTRTRVAPGLTGLWQIEARDNPSFGPYRRLDLFYVENWSPLLDLGIIVTTVARVIGRALRMARPGADVDTPDTIVLD